MLRLSRALLGVAAMPLQEAARPLCSARLVETAVAGSARWADTYLIAGGDAGEGDEGNGASSPLPPVLEGSLHLVASNPPYIAATDAHRMVGLMYRFSLAPDSGMLFVHDSPRALSVWMRNTYIPLSIAFVDDDGTIVNIADMSPRSEQSHCPARPIRFALEMERGWFAARGLLAGAKLNAPTVFRGASRQ